MPLDFQRMPLASASFWEDIDLVVFDVDGTLYDQRRLRVLMAFELLIFTVQRRSMREVRIVSAYRKLREEMGDENQSMFESVLLERTAAATRHDLGVVTSAIFQWIDQRPLRHLASCRFAGLTEVFEDLKRHGKRIGVWSDYPLAAKLQSLGLRADFEVYAGEPSVDALKPNPKGLLVLMERAGASPDRTLMIGDRFDRDGIAANLANTRSLIKNGRQFDHFHSFKSYLDEPFLSLRCDL